jgi:uncharacterized protein YaeQ
VSKLADRVAVYTHRDVQQLLAQLEGQRIHRAAEIPVYAFDREFVAEIAAAIGRRTGMSVNVADRGLFVALDDRTFEAPLAEHRLR